MTFSLRRAAFVGVALPVLVTAVLEAQDRSKSIEQEAKRQVGSVGTICGTVVAYQCQRPERTSLLALEKASGPGVSVAIKADDRSKFGPLFESRHVLLSVCATGPVQKRKNRYLIGVKEPAELSIQTGSSAASVSFGPDAVAGCDEGVELPKVVKEVKPKYTQAALDARIEGVVLLETVVLTTGQIGSVRLLRSLDQRLGLDDEALQALHSWRFLPGTLHGQPVPVVVTVELSFRLRR